MEPNQATFLLGIYVPQIQSEWEITKKVLQAVPDTNQDYRPDPKSRTASELAWHILSSDIWFLEGLISREFKMEEAKQPEELTTIAGMIAWFDREAPPLIEKLKATPPEKLAEELDFFGLMNAPAVTYLGGMGLHTAHHRGQLTTYLRAMGGKVPSIYGGSADEPFEPPEE